MKIMYNLKAEAALAVVCAVSSTIAFGQQSPAVDPLSINCHTTLTKAGVGGMKICISEHGNLLVLESPVGTGHIFREGYALSTGGYPAVPGGTGFDFADSESGFGPPTIVQPSGKNTLPLTITRRWNLGSWQGKTYALELKQVFAWDTAEHDVTITMTLKNVGTATYSFPGGRLGRWFDGNIDGKTNTNYYYASQDSVFAWQTSWSYPYGNALSLTNLSIYTAEAGIVNSSWRPEPWDTFWDPSTPWDENPIVGNSAGLLTFSFGPIAKGSSRNYKVTYRRF